MRRRWRVTQARYRVGREDFKKGEQEEDNRCIEKDGRWRSESKSGEVSGRPGRGGRRKEKRRGRMIVASRRERENSKCRKARIGNRRERENS